MADPISPPLDAIAAKKVALPIQSAEAGTAALTQTAEKITKAQDPLAAVPEKSITQPDSGNWAAAAFIRAEQTRLAAGLGNPATSAQAMEESKIFASAVAAGGKELTHYIEAHSDQIKNGYFQSEKDARAIPEKPEGQQAAVDLITEEAESLNRELESGTVIEPGAKLEKLAGFSSMLSGVAGKDHEGLTRLKAWLIEKTSRIQEEIARKQQELGIDKDMQEIQTQLSQETPAPGAQDSPAEVVLTSQESPESFTAQEAAQIRQAIESGDESLLPAGNQSLIRRAQELLKFSSVQMEKQQKLQKAQSWANSAT